VKILKIGWWCDADVAQQDRSNIKLYVSAFTYIYRWLLLWTSFDVACKKQYFFYNWV